MTCLRTTLAFSVIAFLAAHADAADELSPEPSLGGVVADELARSNQGPSQEIAQVREMYQRFAQAYQAKNLNGVIRTMSPQWSASDGSGVAELEDTLRNSFRVFDTIQFKIENLQVRNTAPGSFTANYSATLSGRINRLNIKHEETSSVTDTVVTSQDGMRIVKTTGNVTIKAR